MNVFAAGSARALLFKNTTLIGVAKTLTDTSTESSISAEEVRAGSGNLLFGKYFHTSNFNLTLTDAIFNLNYIAISNGTSVASGGVVPKEENLVLGAVTTQLDLTETPIAFEGSMIGWYKKSTDTAWSIGAISGTTMTITAGTQGDTYCVKYFYSDPNAQNVTLKAQYVPSILHVVLLVDLFPASGDGTAIDPTSTKAGRLIIDVPQLQLDGNQNLGLTATGAATTALNGSALAVEDSASCESDPYYGTITQQIFGESWKDRVIGLAVSNAKVDLDTTTVTTEALEVYAIFGGIEAPRLMANADLTFAVETGGDTYASVGAHTGVVTAVSAGHATINAILTGYSSIEPAYAYITVT